MKFKTLVIKKGTKYQEFLHFVSEPDEWGTSGTPHLYPMTATMEALEKFYPNMDFLGAELVIVEVKIV